MERASSSDAFGLLGLPAQFDLDLQVIERAFFEKSKETHPDRFANAPAAERVQALSRARALNDAYKTLKNPIARAEYLLAQGGVRIGDNEQLDPEFLARVLELREELAEAKAAHDLDRVGALQGTMSRRKTEAIDELPQLFATKDKAAIKRTLIVLRYVERYLEECDAALDEEE